MRSIKVSTTFCDRCITSPASPTVFITACKLSVSFFTGWKHIHEHRQIQYIKICFRNQRYILKSFANLSGHILIATLIQLSRFDIIIRCLNSKNLVRIFFICNANINILNKVTHHFLSFFGTPKIFSEVQITGNRDALFLCFFTRFEETV